MFDNIDGIDEGEVELQYDTILATLKDPQSAATVEFRPAKPVRGAHRTPAASISRRRLQRTPASTDSVDHDIDDEFCNGRESSAKRKRSDLVEVMNTSLGDSMAAFSGVLKDGGQLHSTTLKDSTNLMVNSNEKSLAKVRPSSVHLSMTVFVCTHYVAPTGSLCIVSLLPLCFDCFIMHTFDCGDVAWF